MENPYVRRFERNPVGRDFAVGDIHGCFTKVQATLLAVEFDESVDRLFSVGDLVDRGPESHWVLEWLQKPWFHAIQGNHEDMAIRYVNPGRLDRDHYMMNGGAWLIEMPEHERGTYVDPLARLPYLMEVETEQGLVGIVHADCACPTWSEMIHAFAAVNSKSQLRALTDKCLWSRDRIATENRQGIADVRAIVVGHTPLRRPAVLGNVYHIDTGGWLREGYFTLLDLASLHSIGPMPKESVD
jgi:serine/threonine protein phosphatase 1